jgi:hypothetical protein
MTLLSVIILLWLFAHVLFWQTPTLRDWLEIVFAGDALAVCSAAHPCAARCTIRFRLREAR